jgi:hypothetical protein
MNHQPFEDWLFSGEPLDPKQERELRGHLQNCADCAALAEVDLALRTAKVVSPAPGFAVRFQARLARQRKVQRRQQIMGTIILILGGATLLTWFSSPLWLGLIDSPAQWVGSWIAFWVFAFASLRTVSEIGSVLLRVVPDFIPAYVWLIATSTLIGLSLLWTITIWKLTHISQGVSQ